MPTTANKAYSVQTVGSNSGTWGAGASHALNEGVIEIIDLNLGGTLTKALASTTPVTLTTDEAKYGTIRFTGTLTANITIRTPNLGSCFIENATSGAFTVSVIYWTGAATVGTAVECPQGYATIVITDATNGARRGNDAPGEPFVASGASASEGLVPTPGTTAGTGRYLREDATWVVPPFQWTPGGRLTLTTGVPVTTSDVTAAGTVYYKAMAGDTVPIYGSSASAATSFAPVTITGGQLSLTLNNPNHAANTNYDVFMFLDGSTPRIGTGPPWTSATARGTGAGTTQLSLSSSGIYVNTVAATMRNGASTYSVASLKGTYLGTIRTIASGQTADALLTRFVFNAYNQVARNLAVVDTTDTWNQTGGTTFRQANGSTANQVAVVIGLEQSCVSANVLGIIALAGGSAAFAVGVGLDSTTVSSARTTGTFVASGFGGAVSAEYNGYPGLGYHYLAWLELAGVTSNWAGDNGTTYMQSGMTGTVWA